MPLITMFPRQELSYKGIQNHLKHGRSVNSFDNRTIPTFLFQDLCRTLPILRNSLSCTVCEGLLVEPYTPEVTFNGLLTQ